MNLALRTIGIRTAIIIAVLGVVAGVYVLQTEGLGTTFATNKGQGSGHNGGGWGGGYGGKLELLIDNVTWYNGVKMPKLSWYMKDLVPGVDRFFKFGDIKPGDYGTTTMSVHVKKQPAWVCLDFTNLKDMENGRNEPEGLVDTTTTGELSSMLEFFAWYDDGDNKYEMGEKPMFGTAVQKASTTLRNMTYAVADHTTGAPIPANTTKYVGITWCAGDLTVSTTTAKATCNGSMVGNETQTDSMSVDISLRAVQSASNNKFKCTGGGSGGHDDDHDDHDDDHDDHDGHDDDDDGHGGHGGHNGGWDDVKNRPGGKDMGWGKDDRSFAQKCTDAAKSFASSVKSFGSKFKKS